MGDCRTDLLDLSVAELNRIHYGVFSGFAGAGFNHHDALGGAHHHDVERALAHLFIGGIDDELAIDLPHANRAHGVRKGNV